ncbi:MAG: hypothetical protein DMG39_28255 [Acidobacteria bacterium]|nr:MAG: hypothetical protein DMG39_28255 [Acidobacteriota bacterium]
MHKKVRSQEQLKGAAQRRMVKPTAKVRNDLQFRAQATAQCCPKRDATSAMAQLLSLFPLALILQSAPSDTTMPCEPPGDAP